MLGCDGGCNCACVRMSTMHFVGPEGQASTEPQLWMADTSLSELCQGAYACTTTLLPPPAATTCPYNYCNCFTREMHLRVLSACRELQETVLPLTVLLLLLANEGSLPAARANNVIYTLCSMLITADLLLWQGAGGCGNELPRVALQLENARPSRRSQRTAYSICSWMRCNDHEQAEQLGLTSRHAPSLPAPTTRQAAPTHDRWTHCLLYRYLIRLLKLT